MNTRFLFIISLIVAVFAVWFYRHEGELDTVINLTDTNIEYEATDILAVQTNTDGIAEYSLTADNLTHYTDENIDRLQKMTLNWRPDSDRRVAIDADDATLYHNQAKVVMNNNVVFSSQTAMHPSHPPMILVASQLIGDLEQKTVYSNQPIEVTQGKNSFQSSSFTADLTTGDYDFAKIAVTFMPPPRQDVPLF